MLFLFPRFTPVSQLGRVFDAITETCNQAGLDQVSGIHISFLAWRGMELCDVYRRPGCRSQLVFHLDPTEEDPHRRVQEHDVTFEFKKVMPQWSASPYWEEKRRREEPGWRPGISQL